MSLRVLHQLKNTNRDILSVTNRKIRTNGLAVQYRVSKGETVQNVQSNQKLASHLTSQGTPMKKGENDSRSKVATDFLPPQFGSDFRGTHAFVCFPIHLPCTCALLATFSPVLLLAMKPYTEMS